MTTKVPDDDIYVKEGQATRFLQLARKIEMDHVTQDEYFGWLDDKKQTVDQHVPGAKIVEKVDARENPPLNTAIYYDTDDFQILPTGALLRTSCNKITHAFCAYKAPEDNHGVREDNRHVFDGDEKRTIQHDPSSDDAVSIVKRLLRRDDITHPGTHLERRHGIRPTELHPALLLDDLRYTFYGWLDEQDALRCSIDRAHVRSLRDGVGVDTYEPVTEVEIAIYPRVSPEVAQDPRLTDMVDYLVADICETFGTKVTKKIKYQRSAEVLRFPGTPLDVE